VAALLFHVLLDRQSHDPLAAVSVVHVFPLRAYSFFEKHVVGVGHYLVNSVGIVVHLPEVLYGVEAVDLVQDVFVMTPLFPLLFLFVVT